MTPATAARIVRFLHVHGEDALVDVRIHDDFRPITRLDMGGRTLTFATMAAARQFAITTLGLERAQLGTDLRLATRVLESLDALRRRGAALPPNLLISRRGLQQVNCATLSPNLSMEKDGTLILRDDAADPILQINPAADIRVDQWSRRCRLPLVGYLGYVPTGRHALLLHEIGHYEHLLAAGVERYYHLADHTTHTTATRAVAERVSERASDDICEFVAETFAGLSVGYTYDDAVMELYRSFDGPAPLVVGRERPPLMTLPRMCRAADRGNVAIVLVASKNRADYEATTLAIITRIVGYVPLVHRTRAMTTYEPHRYVSGRTARRLDAALTAALPMRPGGDVGIAIEHGPSRSDDDARRLRR